MEAGAVNLLLLIMVLYIYTHTHTHIYICHGKGRRGAKGECNVYREPLNGKSGCRTKVCASLASGVSYYLYLHLNIDAGPVEAGGGRWRQVEESGFAKRHTPLSSS